MIPWDGQKSPGWEVRLKGGVRGGRAEGKRAIREGCLQEELELVTK